MEGIRELMLSVSLCLGVAPSHLNYLSHLPNLGSCNNFFFFFF